ncbi:hypothetical protein BDR22DRAFT_961051 [Usnea florida]
MTSNSYSLNDGANLVAIASANPTDAESWSPLDHQSTAHQIPLAFQSDALRMMSNPPNEVGIGLTVPNREPNGWAAKEAWARHRALIKQLYLCEKKPLKEVMRHMKDEHGFRATTKMYKTHIQQWGLDKKVKDAEMRAVVRKNKQRADQGKSSIIRIRGQSRGLEEFLRHCDRKGLSIDDIIARHASSPTPDTVELLTPGPSRISTPQPLEVPERIFRCIRDYYSGSFESGNWVRTEVNLECYSIKCGQRAAIHADKFCRQCDSACTLFSMKLFEEGGRSLTAAFGRIKRMLLADQPGTISEILRLISKLRSWKREEIALIILRHFSDLSKELLGREHPLTHIFEWYGLLYASDSDEVVSRCIQGMADYFESFVGALHLSTLRFCIRSIEFVTQEGEARIQKLQKLLNQCEGDMQPYDNRVLWVRFNLALEYYNQNYFVESRNLGQENFADSQDIPSKVNRKHYETPALRTIALCQYALGEVDLGIANLNEAINSRLSIFGPQDPTARYWLVDLEVWHLEQGNWDVAEQIRDYRMRTLEPIDD